MSVSTVRPESTTSSDNIAIEPPGTIHGVLGDDLDTSWVEIDSGQNGTFTVKMPEMPVLPDGVATIGYAVRLRTSGRRGQITTKLFSDVPAATIEPFWNDPTTTTVLSGNFSAQSFGWFLGGTRPLKIDIDSFGGGGGGLKIYEVFVDWVYVDVPVTTVLLPTGTIDNTNLAHVQWSGVLDSVGGLQTQAEVKIFNEAQYTAGGFDPNFAESVDSSGLINGAGTSWDGNTRLPNGNYRSYVRQAQTVPAICYPYTLTHWGDWDYEAFVVDVPAPRIPNLIADPEGDYGRIRLEITMDDTPLAEDEAEAQFAEIERSDNQGKTWRDVRTYIGGGRIFLPPVADFNNSFEDNSNNPDLTGWTASSPPEDLAAWESTTDWSTLGNCSLHFGTDPELPSEVVWALAYASFAAAASPKYRVTMDARLNSGEGRVGLYFSNEDPFDPEAGITAVDKFEFVNGINEVVLEGEAPADTVLAVIVIECGTFTFGEVPASDLNVDNIQVAGGIIRDYEAPQGIGAEHFNAPFIGAFSDAGATPLVAPFAIAIADNYADDIWVTEDPEGTGGDRVVHYNYEGTYVDEITGEIFGDWVDLSGDLINGWTGFIRIRKSNWGQVEFDSGSNITHSGANGDPFIILDSEYWPALPLELSCAVDGFSADLDIGSDGTCQAGTAGEEITLNSTGGWEADGYEAGVPLSGPQGIDVVGDFAYIATGDSTIIKIHVIDHDNWEILLDGSELGWSGCSDVAYGGGPMYSTWQDNKIRKFSQDGDLLDTWDLGTWVGAGISGDVEGNVWVSERSDAFTYRIQKFSSDGEVLKSWSVPNFSAKAKQAPDGSVWVSFFPFGENIPEAAVRAFDEDGNVLYDAIPFTNVEETPDPGQVNYCFFFDFKDDNNEMVLAEFNSGRVSRWSDVQHTFDNLVQYRARTVHTFDEGTESYSEWFGVGSQWNSDDEWLKHPTDPTLNAKVRLVSYPGSMTTARKGEHQPLGAEYPIVISDSRGSETGTIKFRCDTSKERRMIRRLINKGVPLLLQCPHDYDEEDKWISFGDHTSEKYVDTAGWETTTEDLPWTRTDRPIGNLLVVDE